MGINEGIDIKKFFDLLWTGAKWIVLTAVIFAISSYLYSVYFITPIYTTDVTIYVSNKKTMNAAADRATREDITTSETLVPTYISIMRSRSALLKVVELSNLKYSSNALRNMITTSMERYTGIFKIYIKNSNPENAVLIANTVAKVVTEEIPSYVEGSSASVIDYAEKPTRPSSPNVGKNVVVSFLAGLIASILVILLFDIFDVRIKTESDLMGAVDIPILGTIPVLDKMNEGAKHNSEKNADKGGNCI